MKFYRVAIVLSAIAMTVAIPRFARAQTDRHGRPLAPQAQATADDDDDTDEIDASDKADAVIKRHSKELKVAHVRDVESDEKDNGEVVINVEVDKKKNIDEVARKVPPRLEGFAVDVVVEEAGEDPNGALSSDADQPSTLTTGTLKAGDDSSAGSNVAPGNGRSAFQSESHYLGKTKGPVSPSSSPQ